MRRTPLLILFFFFLSGAVAAYLAVGWLRATTQQAQRTAQQAVQTVPVVVAAKEVPAGSVLGGEVLKVVNWPRDAQVAGMVAEPDKLHGRVVRYPLVPGEPVLESKLAPLGAAAGLPGLIQNNRRAMTIKVDEASGVAGFIAPGHRVDVLVTLDKREFKDDPIAQVVLQNLLVLGRGQDMEPGKPGEKPKVVPTVTLEVTPEEAEKLTLAAREGSITLALRGWSETPVVTTAGAKASALVQQVQKPEPGFEAANAPPVPAKKREVEILRGTTRETVAF